MTLHDITVQCITLIVFCLILQVFDAIQPLCVSVLDGYNVCIFACKIWNIFFHALLHFKSYMLGSHHYFSCRLNLIFSMRYFIPYSQDLYQHQHQEEYVVSKNNVYYLRYTDFQLPYLFFICFISPLLTSHSLFFNMFPDYFFFLFRSFWCFLLFIIDSTLLFYTPSSFLCPFLLLFLSLVLSCSLSLALSSLRLHSHLPFHFPLLLFNSFLLFYPLSSLLSSPLLISLNNSLDYFIITTLLTTLS